MSTDSKTICVIEDNMPIRKLLTTILKRSGFETIDFGDGTTAIEWLKSNTPYALLVDYVLPDLDGGAIIEFIRQKSDGNLIPVIAVTGLAQENDKEKILKLGFDSYIAKPIQTATFVDQIKEIIEKKQA
ncbi:response regulator [Bacteroidota bacterium]